MKATLQELTDNAHAAYDRMVAIRDENEVLRAAQSKREDVADREWKGAFAAVLAERAARGDADAASFVQSDTGRKWATA